MGGLLSIYTTQYYKTIFIHFSSRISSEKGHFERKTGLVHSKNDCFSNFASKMTNFDLNLGLSFCSKILPKISSLTWVRFLIEGYHFINDHKRLKIFFGLQALI